jgi:hypothetical protein
MMMIWYVPILYTSCYKFEKKDLWILSLELPFYLKKKVYEITWNWKRKQSRNGIYKFLNWNQNWKYAWKVDFMNFWTSNWHVNDLTSKRIYHGFDQQLLFINVNTFWINGKKMRFVNFDFGIGEFGILILEFCFRNSDVQNCACKTEHNTVQPSLSNATVWHQPLDLCADVIQIREHICFQS